MPARSTRRRLGPGAGPDVGDVQAQVAELGANIPSRVSQDALDAFLTFTPPENNQAFLDGLTENPRDGGTAVER